jgi:hypothetical protein
MPAEYIRQDPIVQQVHFLGSLKFAIDFNEWQDSSVQICEILQRKCTIPDYLHVKSSQTTLGVSWLQIPTNDTKSLACLIAGQKLQHIVELYLLKKSSSHVSHHPSC